MNTSFTRSPSPGLDALQTAGVLSALMFLVNCTFEVLVMHGLYAAQYPLIALLLWSLAVWALWEVAVMARKARIPLASLNAAICLQLGVAVLRHILHAPAPEAPAGSSALAANLDIGLAVVYGPVYLIEFLLIGKLLINAFSYAERVRANQLEEQIAINQRANDALAKSNAALNHANTELACSTQAAQDANLAKSHFLAIISHEIRTPLNGVLGMAQVLLEPNISEAARLDFAGTILKSGRILMSLLNDILDLSKIEAGKLEIESTYLAPEQIVSDVTALFKQLARDKGLLFESQWLGPARSYLGDSNRIRQMLSNLLSNAIKFTDKGSIRIDAREVACADQIAILEFGVSDSGVGIAADKLALLFQPFSQLDSSTTRNYGGSGLGLSIVRMLAHAMGGEVGVESDVGKGARFWFRVQVELTAGDAAGTHLQSSASTSLLTSRLPQLIGQVMVIEDNPINQKIMRVMLEKMGLEAVLVNGGQEALDALRAKKIPQVILTDIQMPEMDGFKVTQCIRQWEAQTQSTRHPIIAVSADAFNGVRERCLLADMDDAVKKPVIFGELRAALERWLPVEPLGTPSAQVVELQSSVDPADIASLLAEILPLLEQGKVDAIARYKALQALVAGSEIAAEIAEAGLPLKKFRFDLAYERMRDIASKYGWETTP